MRIKSDGRGGWEMLEAPEGAQLRRIAINFVTAPTETSLATSPQGPASPSGITVKVEMKDGSTKKFQDVVVEWALAGL